jgi:hypothetical protein
LVAGEFEETKPELISDDGYAQVPPGQIAASIEGHGDEEEEWEEGDDDGGPLPPEMVAAEFEEAGPELIDHDGYAPVPPDMIAASFEAGCSYEEEKVEEGDDEEAPRPPDMVASSFEGHGYEEEEKREEGEDDEAPRPPSMMAASCEEIDAADHKATKATKRPPVTIDEGVDPQVPEERNDGTPANTGNQGSRFDPSSSSNQPPSTASNVQVGTPSITPTPQREDQRSLSLAINDQGHAGMTIPPTEESMPSPRPNFDRSQQSLPLLEATLVQDVPNEPVYIYINTNSREETVYDAVPMPAPEIVAHGWSRISLKFRVMIIGLVLVAMAAIVAVVVTMTIAVVVTNDGSPNEPPIPPITTSTNSTSAPGTETNTVSE